MIDFGPKFFKVLFTQEDLSDVEERRKTLFDFDFAENFYSKNFMNTKSSLAREQIIFIGNAFVSNQFTDKNKMQLLKFLLSNIKACQQSKDPFIKIQKLFCLLTIALTIISKIFNDNLDKPEKVDQELLEIFKDICEQSWVYPSNHARITCSLIYAMVFKLGKPHNYQETLLK